MPFQTTSPADTIDPEMNYGFFGTDYKTITLENMESVYLKRDYWGPLISRIGSSESSVFEITILATCNRFEIYYVTDDLVKAQSWIIQTLSGEFGIDPKAIEAYIRTRVDLDVAKHLFSVACGMESMVFGEDEILAQVKNAYSEFHKFGTTGPFLNKLFQSAISIGKRVRHETAISRGAYSVSSIAVDAIRELVLDYFGRSILIVGAGIIGTRALKKLYSMGHPSLTVCNRSIKKLEEVVTQHDGVKGLPFSSLQSTARTFDIVIVATSSPQHILSNDAFGTDAITSLIIDLSVPRNVNANAASPTRQLVTVEGLKAIAERNVAKRRKEFVKAQLLLDEDIEKIQKWLIHRNTLIQNL